MGGLILHPHRFTTPRSIPRATPLTASSPQPQCAPHHKKVAYFDVDGTLINSNIVAPYALLRLRELVRTKHASHDAQPPSQPPLSATLWAPAFALKCVYFIALDYVDRPAFNTVFYRHYAGRPAATKHQDAQHIFATYMLPKTLANAKQYVTDLKSDGWTIVLVTGSLDHLMAPVARHFDADDVIAATLEEDDDGYFTGNLVGPPVVGAEKVRRMRADAAARGVDLAACAAYSDSYSDLPMLQAVGAAHAVNADARLAREAQQAGWPLLNFL